MPAIFPFLPAHIGIARANLPSERGTISMTAHQETMNEILDLLDELNVDQLANLGHKIKGIAEKTRSFVAVDSMGKGRLQS